MTTQELDPEAIGRSLTQLRRTGMQWDKAWPLATSPYRVSNDERSMFVFLERHFRAAYYNTDSSLGRFNASATDVSMALVMAGARRREPVQRDDDRCRSGDGCDRLATRGTFGKHWCDYHHAELVRIREMHFPGGGFGDGQRTGSVAA